jgi:hypothetical protein
MFDDFGDWVEWCDSENERVYDSGPGPFRVVHVKKTQWVPECTCGGEGGGLLDDGHSPGCAIHCEATSNVVTVEMSGRHRSFDEGLFKKVPQLRRR